MASGWGCSGQEGASLMEETSVVVKGTPQSPISPWDRGEKTLRLPLPPRSCA